MFDACAVPGQGLFAEEAQATLNEKQAAERFAAMNCALLGLSVDSLYAHLGWIRAIRDHFGVTVGFPIVEDPSMVIGRAYGMVDETSNDSATVRATGP